MTEKTVYPTKAPGPQPICFCLCLPEEALIAEPGQMDCPWCGCGWLFACTRCRKGFTFAVAKEVPFSLREIARGDITRFGAQLSVLAVDTWVSDMTAMLHGITLGERYAYLDGAVHRADPGLVVRFTGLYGSHLLPRLPHCTPHATSQFLQDMLGRGYWRTAKTEKERAAAREGRA